MSRIAINDLQTVETIEAQQLAAVYGAGWWSTVGGILGSIFGSSPYSGSWSIGSSGWSVGVGATGSGGGVTIGHSGSGIGFGFSWAW